MVMENLFPGECRSVLGEISLGFTRVQNLESAVEETIGKEILQAPSAYVTLACCIPLLKVSISGDSSSAESACHCY